MKKRGLSISCNKVGWFKSFFFFSFSFIRTFRFLTFFFVSFPLKQTI